MSTYQDTINRILGVNRPEPSVHPDVDWEAAQKSDTVGFVSPVISSNNSNNFEEKTTALPAPSGPYKAPNINSQNTAKKPTLSRPPVRVERPLPLTPDLAAMYNEELKTGDGLDSSEYDYEQYALSKGSPWYPGYSRVPNTIAPDNKNPELDESGASERLFGPQDPDWRKRNPATWFNIRTYPSNIPFDEEAAWNKHITEALPPLKYLVGLNVPPNISSTKDRYLDIWRRVKDKYPKDYEEIKSNAIEAAAMIYNKHNPAVTGPQTDIDEHMDVEGKSVDLHNTSLFFPDQSSIDRGLAPKPRKYDNTRWYKGISPMKLFPPNSDIMRDAGIHEATHNIVTALSGATDENLEHYPLDTKFFPWFREEPTVASESVYNNGGRFVPRMVPGLNEPYRAADDAYLFGIFPPADSMRVAMAGTVDPTSLDDSANIPWNVDHIDPYKLYKIGIRYWNGPHSKNRTPAPLNKLRFIPDHPTGWYYDRFGEKRLSGGELINYDDLYGDGKPKDMNQLSPNTRRFYENLGQAPQAWIDSIEHPKEYAAAQDWARRKLFPLLRKDISGMFAQGDSEAMRILRDYQHPAFHMINELLDGRDLSSLTDKERYNLIDKVESFYPELRLDPVATPSWLVNAQKIFGLLPELGQTGVRTLNQYYDFARYEDYYRALDDYINYYSRGGNRIGT